MPVWHFLVNECALSNNILNIKLSYGTATKYISRDQDLALYYFHIVHYHISTFLSFFVVIFATWAYKLHISHLKTLLSETHSKAYLHCKKFKKTDFIWEWQIHPTYTVYEYTYEYSTVYTNQCCTVYSNEYSTVYTNEYSTVYTNVYVLHCACFRRCPGFAWSTSLTWTLLMSQTSTGSFFSGTFIFYNMNKPQNPTFPNMGFVTICLNRINHMSIN